MNASIATAPETCRICAESIQVGQDTGTAHFTDFYGDPVATKVHADCVAKYTSDGRYTCGQCGKAIEQGADIVLAPGRAEVAGMALRIWHRACLDRVIARDRRERARQLQDTLDRAVGSISAQIPKWNHARVDSQDPKYLACDSRLRAFAAQWESRSALLLGRSGSGKSTCAVAALNRCIEEATTSIVNWYAKELPPALARIQNFVWTDGFALATARRNSPLGEGEPKDITRAKSVRLLVIDEVGYESKEPSPDLLDIVNARYVAQLPTVVTSGCTLDEFTNRYGVALVRRLAEQGIGTLINCHAKG